MKYAQVIEALIEAISELYHNGKMYGYFVSATDYGFDDNEANDLRGRWLWLNNQSRAQEFCVKWAKRHPKNSDLASVHWLGKFDSTVAPEWVVEIGRLGCNIDHSTLKLGWDECDGVEDYHRALAALSFVTELNAAVKRALRKYPDSWKEFLIDEKTWRESEEYKKLMLELDNEEDDDIE